MQHRSIRLVAFVIVAAFMTPPLASSCLAADPAWVAPMREAHGKFKGTPMYVAKFGDSITYSRAFWTPIGWSDPTKFIPDDGLPKNPKGKKWKQLIKGVNDTDGCGSGWTIDRLMPAAKKVLREKKPEIAIIMIGTNDVRSGKLSDRYAPQLDDLVSRCLAQGCVPILGTIPPFRGRDAVVAKANTIIRSIAKKHAVPLVDYHAAIFARRADDWDGTLISKDGVHPSGGKTNDYSEANLRNCGYALRTWVNFLMVREVYFRVIAPNEAR